MTALSSEIKATAAERGSGIRRRCSATVFPGLDSAVKGRMAMLGASCVTAAGTLAQSDRSGTAERAVGQ
jgi:hypothetical protein